MPLLPPAAGAALLREQCVNTDPQRRLQGVDCLPPKQAPGMRERAACGACCIGTAGFRSSGYVVTEGVVLSRHYAAFSASRRYSYFGTQSLLFSMCVRCFAPSQTTLSTAKVKRLRARAMEVAKSQRGIKAGSTPQQNAVQWQRARAETLRTEERSVRMHKERLAP